MEKDSFYRQPIKFISPRNKPRKPYSPTTLEVMKSCSLRSCFEATPGYEKRLGFAARIGLAFHRTMESFYKYPLNRTSEEETIAEARRRFQKNIQEQIEASEKHPREVGLPRNTDRIARAQEAIVFEAQKYYAQEEHQIHYWHGDQNQSASQEHLKQLAAGSIEVEAPVQSKDGLFKGRIDRVEHNQEGVALIDYKSALRDDLPPRYERQLQLYAYLWHESRGDWPVKAFVIYPLTVSQHVVNLSPEDCNKVALEFRKMLEDFNREENYYALASPGEVCQVCDYRPWCLPFWNWQANEENLTKALENAYWGIKGKVTSIKKINYYIQVFIDWRGSRVQLICPQERFPQLEIVRPGMEISILEANLKGLRHQPKAIISPRTELFLYQ